MKRKRTTGPHVDDAYLRPPLRRDSRDPESAVRREANDADVAGLSIDILDPSRGQIVSPQAAEFRPLVSRVVKVPSIECLRIVLTARADDFPQAVLGDVEQFDLTGVGVGRFR